MGLGLEVEKVRAGVVNIVGSGEEVTSGQIPFTPRAKKVLELALREALSLSHNYIGTEHILLGLVRENEGVAARILLDFDADSEKIRNEVIRMLAGSEEPSRAPEVSDALFDGTWGLLRQLSHEIEERLGRPADAGDLLVLLASVPEGLVALTLAGLGIDAERLGGAVEESRRGGLRSPLLPVADLLADLDEARSEKEAAIKAQQFERAAEFRDRERELISQYRAVVEKGPQEEVLAEVRARLGLDRR